MNQGWECPKCGRCYAPWMPSCSACPAQTTTQSGTGVEPWRPKSGCSHERTAIGTQGAYCIDCGHVLTIEPRLT